MGKSRGRPLFLWRAAIAIRTSPCTISLVAARSESSATKKSQCFVGFGVRVRDEYMRSVIAFSHTQSCAIGPLNPEIQASSTKTTDDGGRALSITLVVRLRSALSSATVRIAPLSARFRAGWQKQATGVSDARQCT
jgi:hypothetical protein